MSNHLTKILVVLAMTMLFAPAAQSEVLGVTPTLDLELTCSPEKFTLPGDLLFSIEAVNMTDHPRIYWGRINVALGEGQVIRNWRLEFDQTVGGRQAYNKQFKIRIPALPGFAGNYRFKCTAIDVTPPAMINGIPAGYRARSECIVGMILP